MRFKHYKFRVCDECKDPIDESEAGCCIWDDIMNYHLCQECTKEVQEEMEQKTY